MGAAAIPYALAAMSVAKGVSDYTSGMEQSKSFKSAALAAQDAANKNYETNINAAQAAVATQEAAAASGGSLGGSGSDVISTSMRNYVKDAVTTRYNNLLTAWDYSNKAKAAKQGAVSGLLSGLVGAGTSYYGAKSALATGNPATSTSIGTGTPSGKLVFGGGVSQSNTEWSKVAKATAGG